MISTHFQLRTHWGIFLLQPSSHDRCPRFTRAVVTTEDALPENESKKFYKVTRSKSIKGWYTCVPHGLTFLISPNSIISRLRLCESLIYLKMRRCTPTILRRINFQNMKATGWKFLWLATRSFRVNSTTRVRLFTFLFRFCTRSFVI